MITTVSLCLMQVVVFNKAIVTSQVYKLVRQVLGNVVNSLRCMGAVGLWLGRCSTCMDS